MISLSIAYSSAADPYPYLRSSARAASTSAPASAPASAPTPTPAEPQQWTSGVSTSRPIQLLHTALQVLQTELQKSIESNVFLFFV